MGKRHWLRYGLASLAIAGVGLGATLVACGDDDSGGGGKTDAGGTDSGPGTDSGGSDSGQDSGKDAGPTLAKLTLVNAATDLGANADIGPTKAQALRVCFKQGKADPLSVAPYPPLPREAPASNPQAPPGVYNGTGGAFPSFGLDLSDRKLVPYVMNAKAMAAKGFLKPTDGGLETTCDEILDPTKHPEVKANEDYWELPEIPAGTFAVEKSYVLALTGCAGDATVANPTTCGPDFTPGGGPGKGNLKVTVYEVTRTAVSANGLGVQFAHLSPQYNATFGQTGQPLAPGFVTDPTDAGPSYKPVTDGAAPYPSVSPAISVSGVTDNDFFASNKDSPIALGGPNVAFAPVNLPAIQALSGLGAPTAPTVYKAGKNFIFIAVGDPLQPSYLMPDGTPGDGGGATFNLRSYHYLAFPTDPEIQQYKP
jgi:hypothetical protein